MILIFNFLFFILLIIMILIGVTFLTLLEQKLLSYIQIRKGPNKVGYMGILQPFCDAIKLFSKEIVIPIYSNYLVYYFSPIFSLFLSLIIWMSFPILFYFLSFKLGVLYIFSCMSLGVYSMMISGWSSNSNYALLGSLRSIAQTISYEVCMILLLMSFFFLILSFNMLNLLYNQYYMSFFFINMMFFFIMIIIFLAETNRAPFDFAEGESELVSGFNVEYSSGGFALIFLSEYSMIIFFSSFLVFMFLFNSFMIFMIYLKIMMISFMFIWIRGSYPRFRYDKLMYMTWKLYLTFSLMFLFFFISLKMLSL